jgi:hypothetical protein
MSVALPRAPLIINSEVGELRVPEEPGLISSSTRGKSRARTTGRRRGGYVSTSHSRSKIGGPS